MRQEIHGHRGTELIAGERRWTRLGWMVQGRIQDEALKQNEVISVAPQSDDFVRHPQSSHRL